jgi:Raf kinase inhibitor-like YbhB/YbcL family protein
MHVVLFIAVNNLYASPAGADFACMAVNGIIFLTTRCFILNVRIMAAETAPIQVTSSAFENEGAIPARYTCDGENINPPLHIGDIPELAKTLAIVVEDPDAPGGTFDHWLIWNLDPTDHTIPENTNPGISGTNSAGKTGYHSPCPPSGSHRYYFHVYALSEYLDLPPETDKRALQAAMEPLVIARGSIMGRYERKEA